MTKISDLTQIESLTDGDLFPVFDKENSQTRSTSYKSLKDAITNNAGTVTNAFVPVSDNGILKDSTIQQLDNGDIFVPNLVTGSESVGIGVEVVATDNGSVLGWKKNSDESIYYPMFTEVTEEGFQQGKRYKFKELEEFQVNDIDDDSFNPLDREMEFIYTSVQNLVMDEIELSSNGEINNLNISIAKEISGEYVIIRKLIPQAIYDDGLGFKVVNSIPSNPDPRVKYVLRDQVTGKFSINVNEAQFAEEGIFYKLIIETTDPTGLKLKGRTGVLFPPLPEQFIPILKTVGFDNDVVDVADRSDIYRRHRNVDEDVTLSTLNDFYTNYNNLWVLDSDHSITYAQFPWKEGQSIEVYAKSGEAVLTLTGFTIAGASSYIIPLGGRYVFTYENDNALDWTPKNTLAGGGDMFRAIYDPQNINSDSFLRSNHTGEQSQTTITDLVDDQDAQNVRITALEDGNFLSESSLSIGGSVMVEAPTWKPVGQLRINTDLYVLDDLLTYWMNTGNTGIDVDIRIVSNQPGPNLGETYWEGSANTLLSSQGSIPLIRTATVIPSLTSFDLEIQAKTTSYWGLFIQSTVAKFLHD
jgi:hypothetical protein